MPFFVDVNTISRRREFSPINFPLEVNTHGSGFLRKSKLQHKLDVSKQSRLLADLLKESHNKLSVLMGQDSGSWI